MRIVASWLGCFHYHPTVTFMKIPSSKEIRPKQRKKKHTHFNKKGGIFPFTRIPGLFWSRRVLHSNPWRLRKRCSQEGRCCGRCHHALWASPDTGHLKKFLYLPLENSDWRKVQYGESSMSMFPIIGEFQLQTEKYDEKKSRRLHELQWISNISYWLS